MTAGLHHCQPHMSCPLMPLWALQLELKDAVRCSVDVIRQRCRQVAGRRLQVGLVEGHQAVTLTIESLASGAAGRPANTATAAGLCRAGTGGVGECIGRSCGVVMADFVQMQGVPAGCCITSGLGASA